MTAPLAGRLLVRAVRHGRAARRSLRIYYNDFLTKMSGAVAIERPIPLSDIERDTPGQPPWDPEVPLRDGSQSAVLDALVCRMYGHILDGQLLGADFKKGEPQRIEIHCTRCELFTRSYYLHEAVAYREHVDDFFDDIDLPPIDWDRVRVVPFTRSTTADGSGGGTTAK